MMVQFSCMKLLQIRTGYSTLLYFLRSLPWKPASHFSSSVHQSSFTVNYLINSCGLSLKAALTAAKKCSLETPVNPDSVLTYLTNQGLSKAQITELITQHPNLLVTQVGILKPKIQFFLDLGLSSSQLAVLIVSNRFILYGDLENTIIPSVNFLKPLFNRKEDIFKALKECTWLFSHNIWKDVAPNVAVLQKYGIPSSNISRLLMFQPTKLMANPGEFNQIIANGKKLGFDTCCPTMFLDAICAMRLSQSTWKAKSEVYKIFGWSDVELLSAFRRQPICMMISEDKIRKGMDFLVNKLKLKPLDVTFFPNLLNYSLEKRIIPRCTVLQLLASENLVSKDLKLRKFQFLIKMDEKRFFEKYVIQHQEKVPRVLEAHKGRVDFLGLNVIF